jgi:hypothetical protein
MDNVWREFAAGTPHCSGQSGRAGHLQTGDTRHVHCRDTDYVMPAAALAQRGAKRPERKYQD